MIIFLATLLRTHIGNAFYFYFLIIVTTIITMLLCCEDCITNSEEEPDTTSHNFIWEVDTLGIYGSYLNDVRIVDENNIWVVGYIRVPDPDSSFDGTGQETFNAANWNGEKWNLMLIHNSAPLYSIWYFDEDDIWVSSGFPKHCDGNDWTMYHLQNMGLDVSVEHIWASSPTDIYFVGYQGSIVHYDGSSFTKMESGTDVNLTDVYGLDDEHIWVSGFNRSDGRSVLLFNDGSGFNIIYSYNVENGTSFSVLSGKVESICAWDNKLFIPTNYGLWRGSIKGEEGYFTTWSYEIGHGIWPHCIRGNNSNDFFIVSDFGDVIHYNGISFKNYAGLELPSLHLTKLFSVDSSENLVSAVGFTNTFQAIVYRGYRK